MLDSYAALLPLFILSAPGSNEHGGIRSVPFEILFYLKSLNLPVHLSKESWQAP